MSLVELRAFLRCSVAIGSHNHLDTDRDEIQPMPGMRGHLSSHQQYRGPRPGDHVGNMPRRLGGNRSLQFHHWSKCLRDGNHTCMDSQMKAQAAPRLAVLAPSRVASFCRQPTISRDRPWTLDDSGIRNPTHRPYRYIPLSHSGILMPVVMTTKLPVRGGNHLQILGSSG